MSDNVTVVATNTSDNYSDNRATATIVMRRKTASQWLASSYIPQLGEPCFETNTYRYKIGDGTHVWEELPYAVCAVDDGELT
jgi:hypothetical protein